MNKLNYSSVMLASLGTMRPMRVYPSTYAYLMRKYEHRSKYTPHQGKQECARRVRQMQRDAVVA